jgi:hypothetical protein
MVTYRRTMLLTRPQGTSDSLQERAAMVILLHEHSTEHARYVGIISLSRSRLLMMNRWYRKSRQRYRHILSEDSVYPFCTLEISEGRKLIRPHKRLSEYFSSIVCTFLRNRRLALRSRCLYLHLSELVRKKYSLRSITTHSLLSLVCYLLFLRLCLPTLIVCLLTQNSMWSLKIWSLH